MLLETLTRIMCPACGRTRDTDRFSLCADCRSEDTLQQKAFDDWYDNEEATIIDNSLSSL